jgi:hypothetical protein
VFVERVKSKSWESIRPALVSMLQTEGFKQMTTLVSDKESALSARNVASLKTQFPHLKVIRLSPPSKAWR